MALADWLVVMDAGRIADQGPPERVWRRPASRFAAAFLGEITLLPAVAAEGALDTPLGRLPVAPPGPGRWLLALRPEHVGPDAQGPHVADATVIEATFQGARRRARVRAAGVELLVHLPLETDAAQGATVPLRADLSHAAVVPEDPPDA